QRCVGQDVQVAGRMDSVRQRCEVVHVRAEAVQPDHQRGGGRGTVAIGVDGQVLQRRTSVDFVPHPITRGNNRGRSAAGGVSPITPTAQTSGQLKVYAVAYQIGKHLPVSSYRGPQNWAPTRYSATPGGSSLPDTRSPSRSAARTRRGPQPRSRRRR